VLFQFDGQLKLALYTSAADIEKDLKDIIGIRSHAQLSVFLIRLYGATATFFLSHKGFQILRLPPNDARTEFAKELIQAYVFLS
jgi:hypothetical protein